MVLATGRRCAYPLAQLVCLAAIFLCPAQDWLVLVGASRARKWTRHTRRRTRHIGRCARSHIRYSRNANASNSTRESGDRCVQTKLGAETRYALVRDRAYHFLGFIHGLAFHLPRIV